MKYYSTYRFRINTTRNIISSVFTDDPQRGARMFIEGFIVPKDLSQNMTGSDIPDTLISESMIERFMEINPPESMIVPIYSDIIDEIERTYVLGYYFSALAASCVTIERTLNLARIHLQKYHNIIKNLQNKNPINNWNPNIDALYEWNYLDTEFCQELKYIYSNIRCAYLHSRSRESMHNDSLRCVKAAYAILERFFGEPTRLDDENDPRFKAFVVLNDDAIETDT